MYIYIRVIFPVITPTIKSPALFINNHSLLVTFITFILVCAFMLYVFFFFMFLVF